MASLLVTQGQFEGQTFEFADGEIVIGRDSECAVALEGDTEASRKHAVIFRNEDDVWCLTDLESANGTYLNETEVTSSALQENDVITIGATSFVFHDDVRNDIAETEAAAGDDSTPDETSQPYSGDPGEIKEAASGEDLALVRQMGQSMQSIRREVGKVIIGQEEVLNEILMCIVAGGHALLIGLPGLAKTLTVNTIAKVLDMKFKRVQFTPDLMPTDITGTEILETDRTTQQKEFKFMQGPIFCNMLLADEINRTPPKTQAALLEAMQEKQVSVGKDVYTLDKPFFVLATQNPIEQEGTYPLPEAQLDRFMFNIFVDYPDLDEEIEVITRTTMSSSAEPHVVIDKNAVIHLQQVVRKIPVSRHVISYAVKLVRSTRPKDELAPDFTRKYIQTGAGPRAGQYLILAAKARAVLEGRIHVSCSDVRQAALPVLRHRLQLNFSADSEGITSVDIIERLLSEVTEPGDETYEAEKPSNKKKRK
ncbi:MAG: AAA family ATPase [Kiritimatiellia bacterium]